MQKIEKWRLEELALVLNKLSELLRKGNHSEWANVFHHFHDEAQKILMKQEFDLALLERLVKNIKNCFLGMSSLRNLILYDLELEESEKINQDFQHSKARLLKILENMAQRTIEYIN